MTLNIHRELPPAAAPMPGRTFISGLKAMARGEDAIVGFQRSVCRYYGRRHCLLVSSGAAALTLILKSIKKKNPSRLRVMVPAYTCYSVPAAIKQSGLEVHPIDVDPVSLDFKEDALSKAVRNHINETLAIIPTHLFGIAANVKQLRSTLNEEEVVIIEDAAQAMGANGPSGRLGGIGDVGFFSLGRGKAFSTTGGGLILTDDTNLAHSIADDVAKCADSNLIHSMQIMLVTLFTHFFSRPYLFWLPKSLPFLRLGETIYDPDFGIKKWSAFQAGLATDWQERLEGLRIQRQANAENWMELTQRLGIDTPLIQQDQLPNLIRYPIYIPQRKKRVALLNKSLKLGLGIMPGYPEAIIRIPELRGELSGFQCDNARTVARRLMTLPTHGWVTAADRRRISQAVAASLD